MKLVKIRGLIFCRDTLYPLYTGNNTNRRKIHHYVNPRKATIGYSKRPLKAYRVHRTGSYKLDQAFIVSQPECA